MTLDMDAARDAFGELAARLGMDAVRVAWGIHDLVNENMAAAARVHAAERGLDTRRYALVATGGAGPLHACGVARRLGLDTVVIPPLAGRGLGVRSAAGTAFLRHHAQLPGTARPDRLLDPGRAPGGAGTGGPGAGGRRRGDGRTDHRAALRGHALRGTGLRDPGGGAAGCAGCRPAGRRAAELRAGATRRSTASSATACRWRR